MSNTIIKISRGKYIEESLEVAILRLNTMYHQKGVPCMINYWKSSNHNSFDTVFASGVKDGVGKDCYRIISLHQDNFIWGVGSTLPDVSSLVHGEKYLYKDGSGKWWLVQIASDGRTREFLELPDELVNYTMFDGSKWISDGRGGANIVYREGDSYSREEIDAFMEEATNTIKYVDFDNLTPSQIESLRGQKGDRGDRGDQGPPGSQGPQGIRGYNGTIENFVVLSEADYQALQYKDPYKFYFTYEDEEQSQQDDGDFIAIVDEETNTLIITADVEGGDTLSINPSYASYENEYILSIIASASSVSTPIFTPIAGTYDGEQTIEIRCSTPDSTIYYTTDYSDPTINSYLYNGPLTLSQSCTIKARAFKSGMRESRIAEGRYDLLFTNTVETPSLTLSDGVYQTQQECNIECETEGATIRYTLDGSEPNESSNIYFPERPIVISELTTILKARAFKDYYNASGTVTGVYSITSQGYVKDPVFSLDSEITYIESQSLVITTETVGATICYTLDGSNPTGNSTIYTEPIIISETTTVKAIALMSGMISSNIVSITITISQEEPPTPPGPDEESGVEVDEINNSINDNNNITGDYVDGNSTWVIVSSSFATVDENNTLIF